MQLLRREFNQKNVNARVYQTTQTTLFSKSFKGMPRNCRLQLLACLYIKFLWLFNKATFIGLKKITAKYKICLYVYILTEHSEDHPCRMRGFCTAAIMRCIGHAVATFASFCRVANPPLLSGSLQDFHKNLNLPAGERNLPDSSKSPGKS